MAGDYCQVVVFGESADEGGGATKSNNVYNFHRISGSGGATKSAINVAFQSAIQTKVLAALSADYGQLRNEIRFIDDALDAYVAFIQSHPGLVAGERLPDGNAVTIRMKTGTRGRWAKGSKHYGPIAEDDTDGDVLTAGSTVLFQALGAALVAGFTDSGGNTWASTIVSIGSQFHSSQLANNPTTVVASDVSSYLLNVTLGTMRRRRPKTVAV